jgi:hypothetical protein
VLSSHGSALVGGQVEFPAGDEDVGSAQIAVHDGHIGREIPVTGAVGAVEQMIEAGLVVVVTPDEEASLLIGGGPERASASVADAGRSLPVARAVLVDLGASELDDGSGIVEEVEVADEGVDEGIIEGVGSWDGVEEDVVLEGVVAREDLLAQLRLLGFEQPSALGSVADAKRHTFAATADAIGVGFLQEGEKLLGPAEQDPVSLSGAADPGGPGASGEGGDLRERRHGSGDGEGGVGCGFPEDGEELREHAHPEVVEPGAFGGGLFTDEDVVAGELGEGVSVGAGGETGVEELALVGEEGDEVSVPGVGLLGGVAGDLSFSLHRKAVDEDVVHAGPLAGFGGQTPVEASRLERDDNLREAVGFGHSHGLGEQLLDLLSPAVESAAPQDLAIVREGGGLPLAGEVDAQDERVRWNAKPTTLAFVLFST